MTCDQDLYIKFRMSWAKEKILKHINKQNKLIQICCLIITDMLISAPILHEKSAVAFAEILFSVEIDTTVRVWWPKRTQ